jgi:zinc transporter ZupT
LLLLLLAIDIIGSLLGIYATSTEPVRSRVVAVSSGVLCAVPLVWMLPEMTQISGMGYAGVALGGCLVVLFMVDRFIFPVCPCCTHIHHHAPSGHNRSVGIALPLVVGICLHNFLDGWSTQLASATAGNLGIGMLVGNLVHKAPESIVLGILLRSATDKTFNAAVLAAVASVFLVIGGAAQIYTTALQGAAFFMGSLAFAGSGFLFVGIHMFRAECARNGTRAAAWSLATGFAVGALLQYATALVTRG